MHLLLVNWRCCSSRASCSAESLCFGPASCPLKFRMTHFLHAFTTSVHWGGPCTSYTTLCSIYSQQTFASLTLLACGLRSEGCSVWSSDSKEHYNLGSLRMTAFEVCIANQSWKSFVSNWYFECEMSLFVKTFRFAFCRSNLPELSLNLNFHALSHWFVLGFVWYHPF